MNHIISSFVGHLSMIHFKNSAPPNKNTIKNKKPLSALCQQRKLNSVLCYFPLKKYAIILSETTKPITKFNIPFPSIPILSTRSEERRVGKECISRWSRAQETKGQKR